MTRLLLSCAAFLAITLLLLEASARIYLWHFADPDIFRSYASLHQLSARSQQSDQLPRYSPHRYLGFYPTPDYRSGENRHNRLGYRGDEIVQPKPEGLFRIVCLGGSTTYTSDLEDHRLSYPSLLQRELAARGHPRVEVINAGAENWSSWESLINFELRVLDLEPDLVILYQAVNDVHPRLVWPPAAYRGDNSGSRSPAVSALFMPGVWEYSTVVRMVLVRAGWTASHASLEAALDRRPDTYHGERFRKQLREGRYPQGIFAEVSAAQMLRTNDPRYYRRNVENLVAIARAGGVRVVLATFAFSPSFTRQPRASSPEYVSALEETNRILREIARETGAHLFDFATLFPRERQYYTDGRHVTESGARLKAELFARYLTDEALIPKDGEG